MVYLRVKAEVNMPQMTVSTQSLEFGNVECGRCKIGTIQLYNPLEVAVSWKYEKPIDNRIPTDKHLPLHLRKKLRKQHKPVPAFFDVIPNHGDLKPKERKNVQVKFMPTSGTNFNQRLNLTVIDSTQKLSVDVFGTGIDQSVLFSHQEINVGPILPMAQGTTFDIRIKNIGENPVELYSLDFDDKYQEDEKVLRAQDGFDDFGHLLLPPRNVGDTLPDELMLSNSGL